MTDFFQLLKQIEDLNVWSMMIYCAAYLESEFKEKGETLFRMGDEGDKFYIILRGSVSVQKPVLKVFKFTAEEYYKCLLVMLLRDDKALVKKTIKENQMFYPVYELEDLYKVDEILFHLKLKSFLIQRKKPEDLADFIKDSKQDIRKIGLDLVLLGNKNYEVFCEEKIKNFNPHYIKFQDIFDNIKRNVKVYQNEPIVTLNSGQYFGDVALESKSNKRTATVKIEEDTHLVTLNNKTYNEYIVNEKNKVKAKELAYINENFFFSPISRHTFEKKYFNNLVLTEYNRGAVLFKEKDEVDDIYIIKDGTVEITTQKSLIEIYQLVQNLLNLDPDLKSKFSLELGLNNQPKNYIDKLQKREKYSLFKFCNSKEIFGIEETFYGLRHLNTATIVSEKARLYKCDMELLKKILSEEQNCDHFFRKCAQSKMEMLIQRLLYIRNSRFEYVDKQYSIENHSSPGLKNNKEIEADSDVLIPRVKVNRKSMNDLSFVNRENSFNKNNENSKLSFRRSLVYEHVDPTRKSQLFLELLTSEKSAFKNHKQKDNFSHEDSQIKNLKSEMIKLEKKLYRNKSEMNISEIKKKDSSRITGNRSVLDNILKKGKNNSSFFITEKSPVINSPTNTVAKLADPCSVIALPCVIEKTNYIFNSKTRAQSPQFLTRGVANSLKQKYTLPLLNKLKSQIELHKIKSQQFVHNKSVFDLEGELEESTENNTQKDSKVSEVKEFYHRIKMKGYKHKKKLSMN